MKHVCTCCGRQIVEYARKGPWSAKDKSVAPSPTKHLGFGKLCCADCDELDEYGLFPEERAQMEAMESHRHWDAPSGIESRRSPSCP